MMEVDDHESQSEDANSQNNSSDSEIEGENVKKSIVERVMFTRYDMVLLFCLIAIISFEFLF